MDTELMLDVGQANEFKLACRRAGFSNGDIKRLCEGDCLAQVLSVIRGHAEITHLTHVIDCDADPFIPYDGWTVEKHQQRGQFTWDPSKIKHYRSQNQMKGKRIEGNKLRKELVDQPTENANLLDYLLKSPHLIPEAWKKDEEGNTLYTFFWGTIYRGAGGRLYVRCLCFSEGHWQTNFRWLGRDFDVYDPAAVRAS